MSAFLDHVWRKIRAHQEKFADLPVFPAGSVLPEFDGDMAELHELADKVIAAGAGSLDDGLIEFGIDIFLPPWPADKAAEKLADWADTNRLNESETAGWLSAWREAVAA